MENVQYKARKIHSPKFCLYFQRLSQFSLGADGEIVWQCVNFVESTLEDLISPITLTNTTSCSRGLEMREGDAFWMFSSIFN